MVDLEIEMLNSAFENSIIFPFIHDLDRDFF